MSEMSAGDLTVKVSVDPQGFLRVTLQGTVDNVALPGLFSMAATASEKHQVDRVFVDLLQSELRLNAADIYWVPKKLESHGLRRHRAALLFREIGSDEEFLETVCANRGIGVKVFTDPDQALAWLIAES